MDRNVGISIGQGYLWILSTTTFSHSHKKKCFLLASCDVIRVLFGRIFLLWRLTIWEKFSFCPDDLVHGIRYSFLVFYFSSDLHTRFIRVLSIYSVGGCNRGIISSAVFVTGIFRGRSRYCAPRHLCNYLPACFISLA